MNKKMNTLIFIVVGTIVNVVLALACIFSLLLIVIKITAASGNIEKLLMSYAIFSIIAGLFIAMIIYQRLTRWVIEKFNLEDKLDPLFAARKLKKKPRD